MVLTRSGATSDGMDQHIPSVDRGIAGESETLLSASGVAHVPPGAPPPPTAGPSGASTSAAPFAQSPAPSVQPGTPIVMTDQHLAYLLSLIRAPASPPAPVTSALSGNFANCSSRFDGAKGSDVLAFVDAIEIYKECVAIEDHIALRGLPMLLSGLAATWWQGVKASVNSWPDAIELLKQTYGPRLPPHRVYRKIFGTRR
ncbi:hypothetical protein K1T71_006704 [Dendrolimus kikuchii]|uniref:Uncharacterized protein n=1 Tax=Dendrolimus kikuchii TaxID=765133 RepID=A0ACC1D1X7_9NEOP|nr:hypothetical protein K1T71_006704 [Dendrolimus kikuchii]